jgi:hypothetical protein
LSQSRNSSSSRLNECGIPFWWFRARTLKSRGNARQLDQRVRVPRLWNATISALIDFGELTGIKSILP